MTGDRDDRLTQALRASLKEVERLKAENAELADRAGDGASTSHEPVAIVGVGCRFPGEVADADDLWRLVDEGRDATSDFPTDRGWDLATVYDPDPEVPDRTYCRRGGFVEGVADFDPAVFGISPHEALAMDPQQRLLLEVGWEALERSGRDPRGLRGSRTGVYVGAAHGSYVHSRGPVPAESAGHLLAGSADAVLSGRLSYVLGLRGPSLTVETACSSSLVAIHLAVAALRSGECELALAGGVAVMADPSAFVEFSRQRGLAPDGRCRSFSADADGTGWAEGAGLLVLRRLGDALADGDTVLGVVSGSAVNHDGASNGLTAPSGRAQREVIRAALEDACLEPGDVDTVEAHGTGTTLGDPIEASALLATYGSVERDDPLWLGSVKSNFGHAQAAAGVGGVIKLIGALAHETLPRTLHAEDPTPHVDWSSGAVRLLQEPVAWPRRADRPRRGAVSSFGVGGTNAHLVVEEPPRPEAVQPTVPEAAGPSTWLVSGHDPAALDGQLRALDAATLARPDADPAAVARALATTRTAFDVRAGVVAGDLDGLRSGIASLLKGRADPRTARGRRRRGWTAAALFTGQGSQHPGMLAGLAPAHPVVDEVLEELGWHLDPHLAVPLRRLVEDDADDVTAVLDATSHTQPALLAVEVAVYRLLESWGVRPALLIGHSIGEVAAAHVAGVLSLGDAARLVEARGRLMQALPAGGAMLSVRASEDEVVPLLAEHGDLVAIAAVNGPTLVVVSGEESAVAAVGHRLEELGRRTRRLTVSHAFHSPLMDDMLEPFREVVASLDLHEPELPVVSGVTGRLAERGTLTDPDYWVRQVRSPVRFGAGLATVLEQGVDALVEVGPSAVLAAMSEEVVAESGVDVPAVAALVSPRTARQHPAEATTPDVSVRAAALAAWTLGAPVDVDALVPATPGATAVDLPTYRFQRTRYWLDPVRDDDAGHTYEEAWVPEPVAAPAAARAWRVVGEGTEALADALERAGQQAEVVEVDAAGWTAERLAASLRSTGGTASDVVVVLPGEDPPGPDGEPLVVPAALRAALEVAHAGADADGPLVHAVVHAGAAVSPDDVPSAAGATAAALLRVAALELPRSIGSIVDRPDSPGEADWDAVARALSAGVDQSAVRDGIVLARRLVRTTLVADDSYRPHGAVLVTGGTGALGSHVATWMAREGAEHVVLLSRSGADAPGAVELVDRLTAHGAHVDLVPGDAASRADVARALDVARGRGPLTAVVHAAGVAEVAPLADVDQAELDRVADAKVAGAQHLDALTVDDDLEAFVLFSSGAAAWGSAGQAGYAAANAALDALAVQRRSRGVPATSIAWGVWNAGGMAADPEALDYLRRRGSRPLDPDVALVHLARTIGSGRATTVVADVDWASFGERFTAERPSPLIQDLVDDALRARGSTRSDDGASTGPEEATATDWARWEPAERRRRVADLVREEVAKALGLASEAVAPDASLLDLGFDSLALVRLRRALGAATATTVPAELVAEHGRVDTLAAALDLALDDVTPDASTERSDVDLAALFERSVALGRTELGLDLLATAAALRPTSSDPQELARELVPLVGDGTDDRAVVVCCAGTAPGSGVQEFGPLAAALAEVGGYDVRVCRLPGFSPGEPLPLDAEALLAAQAAAVLRDVGDRPFVLLGHSAGANLAHWLGGRLADEGRPPYGLVLVDLYDPSDPGPMAQWRASLLEFAAERTGGLGDATSLVAMGAYHRILRDWTRGPTEVPVLHVRASDPAGPWPSADGDWRSHWDEPDRTVDVPGDHLTMMTEHAAAVAHALHDWIGHPEEHDD